MLTNDQLLDTFGPDSENIATFVGYLDGEFESWVHCVAERLHEDDNDFLFDFTANADGEIDGAVISLYMGEFVYLARHLELKRLTDNRDATGEDAIFAIRDALVDAHEELTTFAKHHNLKEA